MAQLIKPQTRYTHPEWTYSNNTKYRNAELERQNAERLQNECDRLMDETEKRTTKSLNDVNKKLDQRVDDIDYWKNELDKKLADVHVENERLNEYIKRLGKAKEALIEPLHISKQCLINREGRVAIDLVHDDVQKELLKEVETHEGVKELLQKTLDQATEQLRLNRKAQYRLQKDICDKLTAKGIDEFVRELKPNSKDIGFTNAAAEIDPKSVTPEDWQDFTNDNILNMDRQLFNSNNMRSLIDGILQQTAADQQRQKQAVDVAFRKRISETRDSKSKLEEHLARVLKEISNVEDTIKNLELAIDEKIAPLKLAQTRLEVRKGRPNVENCRDNPQYSKSNSAIPKVDRVTIRLLEEVAELESDIAHLQRRLADAKDEKKALTRRQLDLEEEIQVKQNSLFIDDVECMGIRESIKIEVF